MNSRYFEFDNIKSVDMNYHIFNFVGEDFQVSTYGGRAVNTSKGRVLNIEENNLEHTFLITKMDYNGDLLSFDEKDVNDISNWLLHDNFRELRFGNDINKVYYAMFTQISPLTLDRVENGYMELTFITNKPHGYTNKKLDRLTVEGTREYEVIADFSLGDTYSPIVYIDCLRDSDLEIANLGTGQKVEIKNLKAGERVILNNQIKFIKSDDTHRNIFKDFNREWLHFRRGSNLLQINGQVDLVIETQYPIL